MAKISCKRGWRKANSEEKKRIMKRLMKVYNVKSVQSVYAYIRGERIPNTIQVEATEKAFIREGIAEIWDKNNKKVIA